MGHYEDQYDEDQIEREDLKEQFIEELVADEFGGVPFEDVVDLVREHYPENFI